MDAPIKFDDFRESGLTPTVYLFYLFLCNHPVNQLHWADFIIADGDRIRDAQEIAEARLLQEQVELHPGYFPFPNKVITDTLGYSKDVVSLSLKKLKDLKWVTTKLVGCPPIRFIKVHRPKHTKVRGVRP